MPIGSASWFPSWEIDPERIAHIDASLCQGVVSGAARWPVPDSWVGRSVGVGFGSDLSEEPVYQGVSRPRWIKESSLVVLPDPPLFS